MTIFLTAHIVKTPTGDEITGIDRPILSRNDLPLPFLAESEVSPGYADISSIHNWYNFGLTRQLVKKDFLYFRDRIYDLVIQKAEDSCLGEISDPSGLTPQSGDRWCVVNGVGDFANKNGLVAEWDGSTWVFKDKEFLGYDLCDADEQYLCMTLRIGDAAVHDTQFKEAAITARDEFHLNATPVREFRLQRAETLIEDQLAPYRLPIMATLTSEILTIDLGFGAREYCIDHHKNYWRFGTRGSVEDYHAIENPTGGFGIVDFIYGRSIFTGRGLIDQAWQPKKLTMQEVCDRLYAIIVLGEY